RWRAAAAFPVPGTRELELRLGAGGALVAAAATGTDGIDALPHRATAGTAGALSWGAGWHPNGLARDLRPDEARGLTYTTEPLGAAVSIIGVPRAVLHLAATMPVAFAVVRLSDVAPDGTSAHVATGVLNLTHRRSHTDPE